MVTSHCGTIAQMLYAQKHELNFAQIVGDLHALLVRIPNQNLIFEWDCDDIALFDFSSIRIALGWDASPVKGYAACLTVSVGSAMESPSASLASSHQETCSRLVEQLHKQFPALTILWHQTNEHLTADLIDRLVEELPPVMQLLPIDEAQWKGDTLGRQLPRSAKAIKETDVVTELAMGDINNRGSGVDARRKAREAVQYLQAIRVFARAKANSKRNPDIARQRDVTALEDLHYG